MAYEEFLHSITLESDADFTAQQYHFVVVNGEHQCSVNATSGARVVGVAQNSPSAADRAVTVGIFGVSKVEAAGAIAAGDEVASNENGLAITAAAGNAIVGTALRSAGGSGELLPVLLGYGGSA